MIPNAITTAIVEVWIYILFKKRKPTIQTLKTINIEKYNIIDHPKTFYIIHYIVTFITDKMINFIFEITVNPSKVLTH
jgi:hypothetical protein